MFLGKLTEEAWKLDAFRECCAQCPKHAEEETERPVAQSLLATARTAVWGEGTLKLFLESSPYSLLERIYRMK